MAVWGCPSPMQDQILLLSRRIWSCVVQTAHPSRPASWLAREVLACRKSTCERAMASTVQDWILHLIAKWKGSCSQRKSNTQKSDELDPQLFSWKIQSYTVHCCFWGTEWGEIWWNEESSRSCLASPIAWAVQPNLQLSVWQLSQPDSSEAWIPLNRPGLLLFCPNWGGVGNAGMIASENPGNFQKDSCSGISSRAAFIVWDCLKKDSLKL